MRFLPGRAAFVRIAPFAVFMALPFALRVLSGAGIAAGPGARWLDAMPLLLAGALLLWWRREWGELSRQTLPSVREAALAVGVGLAVGALWVVLDASWATPLALRLPHPSAGADPALFALHALGAVLVLPLVEELFWRSFLLRWLQAAPFTGVDPREVGTRAVVLATFVHALSHTRWLAAMVEGLAFVWLYRRTGRLWVAVIAHATANAALAAWAAATGGHVPG